MKRLFICTLLIFIALYVAAQPPETEQPQRKPEEVAKKQTEMLVRELSICDSAKIDTLYRLHLKYARMRQKQYPRRGSESLAAVICRIGAYTEQGTV